LQHSKHRIVVITTAIVISAFVAFMTYSVVALYRFNSTSSFLYRITQVVPFPVAKAGNNYVAYENYLFQLRHYIYFYQNQQKLDFNSQAGRQQLELYKKQALDQVITDSYVKQLASQHHLSISNKEVNDQITILRRQNRLGGSQQAYEDALRQNFGWSVDDFKRVIKQQLLEQKVISALDTATHQRAQAALDELHGGVDFAAVAAKYSDDASSKASGGQYPSAIDQSDRDVSPITTDVLFKLQPGQISGIVNTGYGLQIIKNISADSSGKLKAAHIDFNFQPISNYVNSFKAKHTAHKYIKP
jgi:parvulin-like peptidyl-prolyl isomerase